MKGFLYTLFLLNTLTAMGQAGNIPKGYDPHTKVVPPDTTLTVTDVFWGYHDQQRLLVKYEYNWEDPKILVVDTETWRNTHWIETGNGFNIFFGFTRDNKFLVLKRFKHYILFSTVKYEIINFKTGERKRLNARKFQKYVRKNGKIHPGKSFQLSGYILSPDRNFFITKSRKGLWWTQNPSDLRQKDYELIIFKYSGKNN